MSFYQQPLGHSMFRSKTNGGLIRIFYTLFRNVTYETGRRRRRNYVLRK